MLIESAPAKLNLALHVRRRRDDGFHELETLFAFVRDGDVVRLDPDGEGFEVEGPFGAALSGEGDNLVTRARDAFGATFGVATPGRIILDKRLPVASGLGGGSADAAATLRLLARRAGVAINDLRLFAVADALGSDVPACLYGRSAIGTGRGEQLEWIDGAPGVPVLLVNPGVAVPTGAVFAAWDGVDRGPVPDAESLIERARAGRNDLYPPALTVAPQIADTVKWLEAQAGAELCRMSGSGATCFATFADAAACHAAAERLVAEQPGWWCLETVLS
ncbi:MULTISPECIES: 4-(cytidine 5'-diphospho)-2-C-methyl-D-erythritol kinase [unclassified Sphingomonas]|uniref:4-(cytidine 5'-diphospho)-2-C-methyl-D-erythritol kinase n=1 Tax=unclassified Sphingomonas TaxID=196159 RepID=UPI002151D182|nr:MULTISPECIES: 4-(cytidine 5'-diphospho)-2-C-methyl-D-erythritol kinase [unclassified Sphingomonas]MCR5872073.1 4-(cytidine 5'-diphospho)-2-C-methyl-D-erythritol kinase [Sphingomonas sp. J344]UUY01317.1 4-(cytidine 5'-diphospho)-2-C-methyl-D-erythritol kinase [Sphingomonas sp. J315]